MANLRVQPRETPGERADALVEVEIREELALLVDQLEAWTAPLSHWEVTFRQGHDFGRGDNVEARFLFTGGDHTCSLSFRLDQIESIQEFDRELWLTLEENDGSRKRLTSLRWASMSSFITSSAPHSAAAPPRPRRAPR